jgi:hypothetical protein
LFNQHYEENHGTAVFPFRMISQGIPKDTLCTLDDTSGRDIYIYNIHDVTLTVYSNKDTGTKLYI